MKSIFKIIAASLTMLLLTIAPAKAEHREHVVSGQDGFHYLVLQVSDNNPGTMTKVMNVAANIVRLYEGRGEEVEVRIVAFNAGLHLLREDTSPVLDRLMSFSQSMPAISFVACGNTITGMTKKEGTPPPIVDFAEVVPGGVAEIMDLVEAGWILIRP